MTTALSRPELVCPAGNLPALKAAVDAGGDTVYLGFRNATNARNFEGLNFSDIILSLKSSDIRETIDANRKMAGLCNYPFHIGITAAGPYDESLIKSSIGIGSLLADGIGDTVRVSMTGSPVTEVESAKRILDALSLRDTGCELISCPTCGRCEVDLRGIVDRFQKELKRFKRNKRRSKVKVALMGCVVNGPGEARDADIGITFGKNKGLLFKKGKIIKKVKATEILELLKEEIRNYKR